MKAVEFQSQLENGVIQVPAECGLLDGQDVRVLILVNEVAANQTVPSADRHSIWKRTEGAWQGQHVREAQISRRGSGVFFCHAAQLIPTSKEPYQPATRRKRLPTPLGELWAVENLALSHAVVHMGSVAIILESESAF